MTASLLAALPIVLGLFASLIQMWNARAPERKQENINDSNQKGRSDIANGDTDRIAVRLDGMLSAAGQPDGDITGQQSAVDIERRIGRL